MYLRIIGDKSTFDSKAFERKASKTFISVTDKLSSTASVIELMDSVREGRLIIVDNGNLSCESLLSFIKFHNIPFRSNQFRHLLPELCAILVNADVGVDSGSCCGINLSCWLKSISLPFSPVESWIVDIFQIRNISWMLMSFIIHSSSSQFVSLPINTTFFSPIFRHSTSFAFPPVVNGSSLFDLLKKRFLWCEER